MAELGVVLGNLGAVRARLGHHGPADRLPRSALALKRRTGNRYGLAETLNDLAWLFRARGEPQRAIPLHREALDKMREIGDRHGECVVLNDLAHARRMMCQQAAAAELYRGALVLAVRRGHLSREADAREGLGRCIVADDPERASPQWKRALVIYQLLDVPQQFRLAAVPEEMRQSSGQARAPQPPVVAFVSEYARQR